MWSGIQQRAAVGGQVTRGWGWDKRWCYVWWRTGQNYDIAKIRSLGAQSRRLGRPPLQPLRRGETCGVNSWTRQNYRGVEGRSRQSWRDHTHICLNTTSPKEQDPPDLIRSGPIPRVFQGFSKSRGHCRRKPLRPLPRHYQNLPRFTASSSTPRCDLHGCASSTVYFWFAGVRRTIGFTAPIVFIGCRRHRRGLRRARLLLR